MLDNSIHMLFDKLKNRNIILGSQSPRRQYLLKELGLEFVTQSKDVEESFPAHLQAQEIPLFLCQKKAAAFKLADNDIVITADTVVWVDGQVLNKPADYEQAVAMLTLLSGKKHEVFTGVCLKSSTKTKSFYVGTDVYFKTLSVEEIDYYVTNFKPYDKAGAYGAQEFIGYIAIEKFDGSYFNVMGLPVKELYEELLAF
jgi:septum formation protein